MLAWSRRGLLLAVMAGVGGVLFAASVVVWDGFPAAADPNWPDGLGPCLPGNCPTTYDPSHGGTDRGYRDNAINVFVGGNMSVVEGAAEAEGRVVVLGNFSQNKSGGGNAYNIGVVGAGSQVRPPANSVALAVGGNISVARGQRTLLDGDIALPLKAHYAGTLSGLVVADEVKQEAGAVAAYANTISGLQAVSRCIDTTARTKATGTAVNNGSETVFTGDGTSQLQIFDVDFDIASASGGLQGITLRNIPSGASLVVNVRGATRQIRTYTGGDGGPLDAMWLRLLWNFPDAATVNLVGPTQFQGSFLVANPASTTTMAYSGTNGRMYTAGNLIHGGGGLRGQEFHSYPYLGLLPDCMQPTTTTTSTSTTTTSTTMTSTTVPGSTTTTTAPSGSTTTTTTGLHGSTTTAPHGGSGSQRHLARTGVALLPLILAGLLATTTGAAVSAIARRRGL